MENQGFHSEAARAFASVSTCTKGHTHVSSKEYLLNGQTCQEIHSVPTLISLRLLYSEVFDLCMGPYEPSPKFFTISGDPLGESVYRILDVRNSFFFKSMFGSWWT